MLLLLMTLVRPDNSLAYILYLYCAVWPASTLTGLAWFVNIMGQSTMTQFNWYLMPTMSHFARWPPSTTTQFIEFVTVIGQSTMTQLIIWFVSKQPPCYRRHLTGRDKQYLLCRGSNIELSVHSRSSKQVPDQASPVTQLRTLIFR